MTMYGGMNQQIGLALIDIDHIRQAGQDILLTPQGSRVARRAYGSLISPGDYPIGTTTLAPATVFDKWGAGQFDKLAQQSRIPKSRLLDEAIADLLKKHGFSDDEINDKQ